MRLSQINDLETAYLPHLGIACLFSSFLDDRCAIWILKALWQVPASGKLRTCVCRLQSLHPSPVQTGPILPTGVGEAPLLLFPGCPVGSG